MTYLYCNGVALKPFEFTDFDAIAKKDELTDFPVVTATAMDSDD